MLLIQTDDSQKVKTSKSLKKSLITSILIPIFTTVYSQATCVSSDDGKYLKSLPLKDAILSDSK